MQYQIQLEQKEDGRRIAEITTLAGVVAYGATRNDAEPEMEVMAFRVIADCIERENSATTQVLFAVA